MGADSTESEEMEEISKYRVVLLGDSGVGKTALVSQFMTSEYINTYDASLGKSNPLFSVDRYKKFSSYCLLFSACSFTPFSVFVVTVGN